MLIYKLNDNIIVLIMVITQINNKEGIISGSKGWQFQFNILQLHSQIFFLFLEMI